MTTDASVSYHRWSSHCFQVMALAEEILATPLDQLRSMSLPAL